MIHQKEHEAPHIFAHRTTPSARHAANYRKLIQEDERQHVEDTPLFYAIRDHKIIPVAWNDLTDAEQRAAYVATYDPCGVNHAS